MNISVFLVVLLFAATPAFAENEPAARVNDAMVTVKDVEDAVNRMIPQISYHGRVSDEKRNEIREKALQDLIDRELQFQDALARGLEPDKKQVSTELKKIKDRFRTKKDYKAALKNAGTTEDGLREGIAKNALVQTVVAKTVTEPSRMGDGELKEYFSKNTAKFIQPESVRLRMISTRDKDKAEAVLARIKAGEDFGLLAAELSEDNYRVKGGDLGSVHKGSIFPELEAEAFHRLKVGESSGLIHSGGTWFILKLEDKQPERRMSFDEVRDNLKKDFEKKRAEELMKRWIADLRAKAKIEVFIKNAEDR